jgi:hypothetical protein
MDWRIKSGGCEDGMIGLQAKGRNECTTETKERGGIKSLGEQISKRDRRSPKWWRQVENTKRETRDERGRNQKATSEAGQGNKFEVSRQSRQEVAL